jgi:hypothetical protein
VDLAVALFLHSIFVLRIKCILVDQNFRN